MKIRKLLTRIVKPWLVFDKTDRFGASPAPGSHKWTDIIDDVMWDYVFNALDEKTRLVGSELYHDGEYSALCDFTHTFYCDYAGRFKWCKEHYMIEYRTRSEWSCIWYDSPVDHILTIYTPEEINIKGYKDGKHVLEEHLKCDNWDDYKRMVTDKYHLKDQNPKFIGRRCGGAWYKMHDYEQYGNYIAEGNWGSGKAEKWILEDEPLVNMAK